MVIFIKFSFKLNSFSSFRFQQMVFKRITLKVLVGLKVTSVVNVKMNYISSTLYLFYLIRIFVSYFVHKIFRLESVRKEHVIGFKVPLFNYCICFIDFLHFKQHKKKSTRNEFWVLKVCSSKIKPSRYLTLSTLNLRFAM